MATEFIDENTVFDRFSNAIREGKHEILIASPWITQAGLSNILSEIRSYASIVRILITLKEQQEGEINDLDTLNLLKLDGAKIRYSSTPHTKMLIVDNCRVIIGSNNNIDIDLGIQDVPTNECGIISDDVIHIGKAKQKYEEIWQNAIDYEHGDIRIEENKIVFSEKGNKKMTGTLLTELGGGTLYKALAKNKLLKSRTLLDIKIPEPFGIRSAIKGKTKEMISPLTDADYISLQKSYWENVSQAFLAELIQKNEELIKDTFTPANFFKLFVDSPQIFSAVKAVKFTAENTAIIDKYMHQTTQFVLENKGRIEKLKAKGVGKNIISYVDVLPVPEEKKAYYLIAIGIFLMAAPATGMVVSIPFTGQRIALALIWGQCVALGAVLIGWGVLKRESLKGEQAWVNPA